MKKRAVYRILERNGQIKFVPLVSGENLRCEAALPEDMAALAMALA